MNKQAGAVVVSILFAVGTAVASYAADAVSAPQLMKPSSSLDVREATNGVPEGGIPPEVVIGPILKIDQKTYYVKDWTGKEVHFQIDSVRTMMDAKAPKVGDRIRAEIEPQGYAYSIHAESEVTSKN